MVDVTARRIDEIVCGQWWITARTPCCACPGSPDHGAVLAVPARPAVPWRLTRTGWAPRSMTSVRRAPRAGHSGTKDHGAQRQQCRAWIGGSGALRRHVLLPGAIYPGFATLPARIRCQRRSPVRRAGQPTSSTSISMTVRLSPSCTGTAIAQLRGRLVQVPGAPWLLTLSELLLTRLVEIVVHIDDLAVSAGVPCPELPPQQRRGAGLADPRIEIQMRRLLGRDPRPRTLEQRGDPGIAAQHRGLDPGGGKPTAIVSAR